MVINFMMIEMFIFESEDMFVGLDDFEMVLGGILMLLNNGFEEVRFLFEKYKYVVWSSVLIGWK